MNIDLHYQKLEQINKVHYLASEITPNGKKTREIKQHINPTKRVFLIKLKLCTSKKINKEVKKRLINMSRTVSTYG